MALRVTGFVILACMAAAAQATVPLASPEMDRRAKQSLPAAGKALLWVHRSDADAASELPVHVNGRFMARTAPGTFLLLSLQPGRHVLSSDGRSRDALTVNAEAGKNYYVAQSARAADGAERSSFRLSPPAAGPAAIAEVRLIDVRAAQAAAAAPVPPVAAQAPPRPPSPPPPPAEPRKPETKEAPQAPVQPKYTIGLRSGSFKMSKPAQTLAGVASTFAPKATGLYSIEGEYRSARDISAGIELVGFKNDLSGPAATTGTMQFTALNSNARMYFAASPSVHPFIGAGVGTAGTRFKGNVVTGVASGISAQFMLGVEMRFGPALIMIEGRRIAAVTRDSTGNKADAGGRAFFAGVGLGF